MSASVVEIPQRFAGVIGCERCVVAREAKILHDRRFHVPQPGYIGRNFANARLLLVGQNPGVSSERFREQDQAYANALNAVADDPSDASMASLQSLLEEIIPTWPVSGSYFPLQGCGLRLQDIAYVNLVRCRTIDNAMPSTTMTERCKQQHFVPWLDWLAPRVVVCVGKWAHDQIAMLLDTRAIPHTFVNRMRSLSGDARRANVEEVVAVVRAAVSGLPEAAVAVSVASNPIRAREPRVEPVSDSSRSGGMNVAGYEVLFRNLGFSSFESHKKLRHPDLAITLYFNRDKAGFVWFAVRAKDFDAYKPTLWDAIPPPQKKDAVPSIRTVVPKAGKEEQAFRDLLGR